MIDRIQNWQDLDDFFVPHFCVESIKSVTAIYCQI
jgi:hypothetical protein